MNDCSRVKYYYFSFFTFPQKNIHSPPRFLRLFDAREDKKAVTIIKYVAEKEERGILDEECGTISTINHVNFRSLKSKFSIFTILSRSFFLYCFVLLSWRWSARNEMISEWWNMPTSAVHSILVPLRIHMRNVQWSLIAKK